MRASRSKTHGPGSSLRRIVLLTVAALLAVGLLAGSSIVVASQQMTKEVNKRVQSTAAVSAQVVGQHTSDLATLLHSYAIRPGVLTDLQAGAAGQADLHSQLVSLGAAGQGFSGAFITDLRGNLIDVQPADPPLIGVNFAYRDWYQGLVAHGGPYVSDAYQTSLPGHQLVIAIADYVEDAAGHPTAMLAAIYSLDSLQSFSTEIAKAQGVTLTVSDRAGSVVSDGGNHGLVSVANDPRVQRAAAGNTGLLNYAPLLPSGRRGAKELSAYTPVPGSAWTVVAAVPDSVAFAGQIHLRDTVLAVAAALVLIILAGTVLMIRGDRRRRDSELQVRRRDRQLAQLLESTDEAFVSTDVSGVINAWNKRAEVLFGWKASEAIGRRFIETLIPATHQEGFRRGAARRAVRSESGAAGSRVELSVLHKDGHEIPVEAGVWAHEDGQGFSGFLHDISERVRQAAEMEAARDEAMTTSRLKSEFLANMSHEIRTPMNGVVGMSGLLLQTDLDQEQQEYAETVCSSAEALLTVIDDILDFSKIEAGKLDIESVPCDLRKVVEESAVLLAARAEQGGLELTCLVDPAVPAELEGDAGRLRQVLLNLLGNAVKFTSRGEVNVTARVVDHLADDRIMVEISVRDTGIGMSEATLGHLFEAFTQADTSTTRRYGGTGLGLAISRQLVELMGGTLTVISEIGVGSTFSALIPFHCSTAGDKPTSTADLTGTRALIVDDNATNRRVLQEILAGWGCISDTADNAGSALALLRRNTAEATPFDVLLLDLNMPDINGYDLARLVRGDPALSQTSMVLLTSSGHRSEAARSEELGIAGFLNKPVRTAQLRATLEEVLHPPRSVEPAPVGSPPSIDPVEADGPGPAARPARNTGPPPASAESPKVLVVEDNLVNQKVASLMLRQLGYRVDVASNGLDALASLDHNSYDAVFMDCQMPIMDGYDATGALRRNEGAARHTPVIALTASAMAADRDRCLQAGMDDYLTKPVQAESLAKAVQRWVPMAQSSS